MDWIVGGLVVLGALATVATIIPIWKTTKWWVRVCDFPRFQIAMIALAVFVAFVVVRLPSHAADWLFLCTLGLVIVWQFTWVGPYVPGSARAVKSCSGTEPEAAQIALLTTNVLLTNRNSALLLDIVHEAGPDVVLAVEVDEWWTDRLWSGLRARYPNKICYPLSNGYGLALFSRLELIDPKIRFMLDDAIPSIRTEVKLRSGASVSVYGVHPRPPAILQDSAERDAELLRVALEIKDRGSPAIVLGDLDVAWSPTTLQFMKAGGLLDPRRGRGFYNTYPARWPGFRYPLDYIFCTRHFQICTMRVLPTFGSDHLPLVAKLVLARDNG